MRAAIAAAAACINAAGWFAILIGAGLTAFDAGWYATILGAASFVPIAILLAPKRDER